MDLSVILQLHECAELVYLSMSNGFMNLIQIPLIFDPAPFRNRGVPD